jgi:aryl-alcohol dehydrogenase-like predicted oxidoreductase
MVAGTIAAALDAGVTLIDTARAYTSATEPAHNERVIAGALRRADKRAVVATKGGHSRAGDTFPIDGRPETIRAHCELSLRALGVESLDLYQLHWPDPDVPLAETMGAFAQLLQEGKILRAGLSNVSIAQIDEAASIVPITSVQNRFSPAHPGDHETIAYTAAARIAYLAYMPLDAGDRLPEVFSRIAETRGTSLAQIVLAWELAQGANVIPIVGSSRPDSIRDSAAAAHTTLTAAEVAAIDVAVSAAQERAVGHRRDALPP